MRLGTYLADLERRAREDTARMFWARVVDSGRELIANPGTPAQRVFYGWIDIELPTATGSRVLRVPSAFPSDPGLVVPVLVQGNRYLALGADIPIE